MRLTPDRYRRITWWALVSLAAIIITGALVRLSGSGLGCSDWPTCEPGEPVAELSFHPMVEFVNRLITGLVSVAVILAVLGSRARVPRRRDLTWLSWGLVAGVVAQIVLGALVTMTHLDARVVLGHFLLSMVLLANAVVLHVRAALPDPPPPPRPRDADTVWTSVMLGWTVVVMVLGTLVTGSGPHTGDEEEAIERLPFALTDITMVHSVSAWILLAVVVVIAVRAARAGDPRRLRQVEVLLALVVAQGAIGYLQYATELPAGLVALHIVGVTAIWWVGLRLHLSWRYPSSEQRDPTPVFSEV